MTPSEQELQNWLRANIAKIVECDPAKIDTLKPIEHYGIDSLQAIHLTEDLEHWLGRKLSPTLVWDYPTIELLSKHLMAHGA